MYLHIILNLISSSSHFLDTQIRKTALHRVIRFNIMGNLFCTEYNIHRQFYLKGSSLGRSADKPDEELDASTMLKDLDLILIFRLRKSWFQELCRWFTYAKYR